MVNILAKALKGDCALDARGKNEMQKDVNRKIFFFKWSELLFVKDKT
ncbi:hypothetical protein FHS11_004760 [Mucilaginibacter gotjawali]|uniref:Uncharacterized protein n=1 Tax=Mucilaginibacter gotjawali TaxID=1550579 RepID=A0A839SJ03_9SPHI|nr:hypothetical protein [Mucilaginibacter gotjawali]